jgi:hypothetical protein
MRTRTIRCECGQEIVYTMATGQAKYDDGNDIVGKCQEVEDPVVEANSFDPLRECPRMRQAFEEDTGIRLPRM